MTCGGVFDGEQKIVQIKKINEQLNSNEIWNNPNRANALAIEVESLKKSIKKVQIIKDKLLFAFDLLKEIEDKEYENELKKIIDEISLELEDLEILTLLNGKYDQQNCYLEIHPGAGGTESCDWAEMLKEMYLKYCTKHDYDCEVISEQRNEEAGIKNVLLHIKGLYAYGYLKAEHGVHRLVRISPFDSNKRRHTSFASVTVIPEFKEVSEIVIDPKDLKIDVYHSSGAGGQSVNTTDSAVRIMHIPSKIVVTCQNERSQLQNKEKALEILKSKLYQLNLDNQNKEIASLNNKTTIEFGSQIRSYTLEPYTLVKDSRTNYEDVNANKVLQGDIDGFLIAYLRKKYDN